MRCSGETHSLLLIGWQQEEGEDHGKAADGVQLAVGRRGAQLVFGSFLCEHQQLEEQKAGAEGAFVLPAPPRSACSAASR